MILKMFLTQSKKEHSEAMQIVLSQLNKHDIESIGIIDGTEYAKAIKRLAEEFAKERKYYDATAVAALLERLISTMTKLKKEPEVKRGKWNYFAKDICGKAFACSLCGYIEVTEDFESSPLDNDCNYCSRCGAKMERGAEE